jgi:hypothetical protein
VGVCLALWTNGLVEYEALQGIDGKWLAMDGAMTKAPLGGRGAHTSLDESLPARAEPLGQNSAQLSRVSAYGMCLQDLQPSWPIGLGSYCP